MTVLNVCSVTDNDIDLSQENYVEATHYFRSASFFVGMAGLIFNYFCVEISMHLPNSNNANLMRNLAITESIALLDVGIFTTGLQLFGPVQYSEYLLKNVSQAFFKQSYGQCMCTPRSTVIIIITRPICSLDRRIIFCRYVSGLQRQIIKHDPKCK